MNDGAARMAARATPLIAALLLALLTAAPPAQAEGANAAQGRSAPTAERSSHELAPSEVKPGMRGYAITAAAHNQLERFDVEVLGVLEGAVNGFPLILIRASGELIEKSGGVAAGMSGSPVYLRTSGGPALIGAIGYVFPAALDQVALVTPIGEMRRAQAAGAWLGAGALNAPGYGAAVPVATPLLMPGATDRASEFLKPLFAGAPTVPLGAQGAASGAAVTAEGELAPGSAIAVSLIRGDASLAAVGTVTTVEEGRVLAFGHPFLGYGRVSLPLSPASVLSIVPSREVPFKLANIGDELIGAAEQDRPAAVAGRLGERPALLPVTLTLLGVPGSPRYEFEVPADERLYPTLTSVGALELLDRALGATGGGHAELAWEVELTGGERVNVIEQVNHTADIAFAAARLAGGPLAVLAENSFRSAEPTKIAISARLSPRERYATLEEAILETPTVQAGDAAHVHVRLQPFRESATVRTITVPIPGDLTGELTLLLRGGSVPRGTGESRIDEKEIDAPRSFGELLDALRHRVQASELVVEAITEDGEVLRLLRESYPFVIRGTQRVDLSSTPLIDGDDTPELEEEPGNE